MILRSDSDTNHQQDIEQQISRYRDNCCDDLLKSRVCLPNAKDEQFHHDSCCRTEKNAIESGNGGEIQTPMSACQVLRFPAHMSQDRYNRRILKTGILRVGNRVGRRISSSRSCERVVVRFTMFQAHYRSVEARGEFCRTVLVQKQFRGDDVSSATSSDNR